MVEHKGFEPLTSSMPWKRASQLRQCPLNTDDSILKRLKLLACWYNRSMSVSKPGVFNSNKTILVIVLAAVVILAGSGYLWWKNVAMSPNNVFWGMIDNNLSTASITRHIVQTSSDKSIDQYIREQFGSVNATQGNVALSQIDSTGKSIINSQTIGTPTNDYSRYVGITTPKKTAKGQTLNTSSVLGIWGKSSDVKAGQTPNAQYFQQSVLTLVPYGNFTLAQRQNLVEQIHNKNVYEFTASDVKSSTVNGRPAYVYSVNINPSAYIELMLVYAKELGLGDIGLDPANYADSPALNTEITVDKMSKQVLQVSYPSTGQAEKVVDQNLEQPISVPENTIPIAELQDRVNKITQ